jgi:hypothetical protein
MSPYMAIELLVHCLVMRHTIEMRLHMYIQMSVFQCWRHTAQASLSQNPNMDV